MIINATELRPGMVVQIDGELMSVFKIDHRTPGNKRGMVQAKLKNVITGVNFEKKFRSSDSIERVNLVDVKMEYLYEDGSHFVFMNPESYEQLTLDSELVGEAKDFLIPNAKISIAFYEDKPILVSLPKTMSFKVIETEPDMKTATLTASSKPAKLETGLIVQVPQFIKEGDIVKIETDSRNYIERVQS